jgi:NAD(P)-dependent dehydrogenase (short-subunit alcohol dehydrogenase family)
VLKEKFDLSGKVALVVGGRGYLGQHFCTALNELGAKIFSADLPTLSLAARKGKQTGTNDVIRQFDVDVTNPESVNQLIGKIIAETFGIDILIYSVTSKPDDCYAPFTECSLDGWRKMFQAEMDGLFLVTQSVGKHMEAAQKGNIILMSSMYGVVGNDQRIYRDANLSELYTDVAIEKGKRLFSHAAYPAVKGAVISLTRYLAAYWEGQNIRVNCISPGGVKHPGENDAFVERYNYRVPLGRKAEIEEISGAVAFLSSDASSYINGHNLIVDGGWTAW